MSSTIPVQSDKNREVEAMVKASRAIVDAGDYQKTARVIFDACSELIGSNSGYVALLSDTGEENEVLFLEAGGMPCDVDPALPMPIRGLRAESYRDGKVVYHNDFMNSEHVSFMPDGHCVLHNVLFAPLIIGGKVEGIMGLANKEGNFTEEDARIARVFGEYAAIGLRNARAEELLRKSEEQFRFMAEQSADILWQMDRKLRFTYLSPSVYAIMGYRPEEMIGKPLYQFARWKDFVKMARIALRTIQNPAKNPTALFETRLIHKNGQLVPVEIVGTPYYGADGKLIGVQGSTRDIQERISAAMALEKSEERYRRIFEASNVGISTTNEAGEILMINDEFCNMLGYKRKELLQLNIRELYVDLAERLKLLRDIKNTGKADNHLIRLKHKDGKTVWIRISSGLFKSPEQGEVLISVFMDVTLQHHKDALLQEKNEEIARQNEEYISINEELTSKVEEIRQINDQLERERKRAEESDFLKSAFLANMSHEIRTPMNAIIGFSGLLSAGDLSEEKKSRFVELITNSGQQLLTIIDDIIDISKIESNQLTIDKAPCRVMETLQDVVDVYERSPVRQKRPEVKLQYRPYTVMPEMSLETDAVRLKQIVGNLLSNALKHTQSGSVQLEYKPDKRKGKPVLLFMIKDTGSGIPKAEQDKVFDRFVQGERKKLTEGTGLGLSIVKGLLDLLGGEIWLDSEETKGTTVYFTLPYTPVRSGEQTEKPERAGDAGSNYSGRRVYIAEDDDASCLYLSELLSKTGLHLERAKNGRELIDLMEKQVPDLVFLDINMPVMDGYEAITHIRERHADLPVVAQTAYAMPDERERILAAGCNGYMAKPLEREQVFAELERFLKG